MKNRSLLIKPQSVIEMEQTLTCQNYARSIEILAILTRRKFDSYIAQGFTREEAMQLLLAAKA